jgi:LPXTG-motif cell wall-anchored protein
VPTPTPIIGYIVTDTTVINDDPLPLGPVATLAPTPAPTPAPTLQPPVVDPTPAPAPSPEITIADEEVPLGDVPAEGTLPKTGESSPAPYYFAGLALAGLGLLLRRRTARTNKRK